MGRSRGGTGGQDPPGKSQVAIGFLRNTGTPPPPPPQEAIEPKGPVSRVQLLHLRMSVCPTVKYVVDQKTFEDSLLPGQNFLDLCMTSMAQTPL